MRDNLIATEKKFGIVPEVAVHDSWETASFISGVWYPLNTGEMMFGPKIDRILARLWWTVKPPSKKNYNTYVKAITYGLRAYLKLPIMGDFIRWSSQVWTEEDEKVRSLAEQLERDECKLRGELFDRKKFYNFIDLGDFTYNDDEVVRLTAKRYGVSVRDILEARDCLRAWVEQPGTFRPTVACQTTLSAIANSSS
jgi:hypothetical protein